MGAWGTGNFENDDAGDWVVEFRTAPAEQKLHEAFAAVIGTTDYIECDLGGYALAAAETVAAAKGKPCWDIPPELRTWAEANAPVATPSLTAQALAATGRVTDRETSEIAQLRAEGAFYQEWLAVIEELKHRLS
jgi:hypothetical protein